jgi:hypothetical protein
MCLIKGAFVGEKNFELHARIKQTLWMRRFSPFFFLLETIEIRD